MNYADEMMARMTADLLVWHLMASGFVLMKVVVANAPRMSAIVLAEREYDSCS